MTECVCESVRMSVCPAHLLGYTAELHQISVHAAFVRGSDLLRLRRDTSGTSGFVNNVTFLPRDALLSAVYAVVVCLSVCVCVCVCVCHTPVLYQNG